MNKKILSATLAGALAVTAVVGGSLAYFTDTDAKNNVFTVGNVDITLTEPHWNGDSAQNVYAGQKLDKNPIVTNDGANACFVRIKVTGLDSLGEDNMITYLTDDHEGVGEGWVDMGNGYFYYDSLLDVDEETTALFDQIKIPETLTNNNGTEHVDDKTVTVTAQAVQAQGAKAPNWAAVQGMTIEEIAAWFGTCDMPEVTE